MGRTKIRCCAVKAAFVSLFISFCRQIMWFFANKKSSTEPILLKFEMYGAFLVPHRLISWFLEKSLRDFLAPLLLTRFFFFFSRAPVTSLWVLEQNQWCQSTQQAWNPPFMSKKLIQKVYGIFRNLSKMTFFCSFFSFFYQF